MGSGHETSQEALYITLLQNLIIVSLPSEPCGNPHCGAQQEICEAWQWAWDHPHVQPTEGGLYIPLHQSGREVEGGREGEVGRIVCLSMVAPTYILRQYKGSLRRTHKAWNWRSLNHQVPPTKVSKAALKCQGFIEKTLFPTSVLTANPQHPSQTC